MPSQEVLKIKTLIIDLSERFGGASTRVISQMRAFPDGEIALAALEGSPVAEGANKAGCEVHIVGRRKTDPLIFRRLVQIIRSEGYQLLDTQNIQSKVWGHLAAIRTGIPLISTLNSWYASEHDSGGMKGRIYAGLEFLTNSSLARYIVVSKDIHSALVKSGVDPAQIDLIYNAVSITAGDFPNVRNELLAQYGLPPDARIHLTAGRMVWVKGHHHFVSAFSQAGNTTLYGFIVGDGDLRGQLEAQIRQAGLADRVFLLGYADHARTLALIKACDVFVMPSLHEGTPVAILEAMALSRPIISSHVGGIGELVENEKEALLIEPQNPDALFNAMQRLARDVKLSARLGQAARQRVMRDFSLQAQVQATRASYQKSLAEWRGSPRSK
jgi:glycosyltransferase involved in cell wall biosynthesis